MAKSSNIKHLDFVYGIFLSFYTQKFRKNTAVFDVLFLGIIL
jgi:hypothetical protein